MAFVHVINRGLQAERLQRAMSADAEEDLLFQAHLQIAAVELIGDIAIFRAIGGHVGIEQEEIDPAHPNPPDLHRHHPSVVGHFDGQRTPVRS